MDFLETDALIIGGGINGSGIARDLALRGIKCILAEKNDFSSGATGACSGMIHGGLRYLMSDVDTTRRSCLDSGYIQRIVPFLIFRIPFIAPVFENDKGSRIYLELAEAYFSAYDRFQPLKRGKPHTRLNREELLKIEPRITKSVIGGVTMDEWGIDPFRLTILNALSAEEKSALILNHTEVIKFEIENGKVKGAILYDHLNRKKINVRARVFINAAGPWLMKVAGLAGANVRIRPGKGVHLIYSHRITNYGYITRAIDGRQVFIMPHDSCTLIGTTDDDYYGDPDSVSVLRDEVEYLVQAIEKIIPSIRKYPIARTMAGVRITLFQWGLNEDDLSRAHRIYNHSKEGGPEGLYTIAGGKLASYRLMAEETGDEICKYLGINKKSETHLHPLPGAEEETSPEELMKTYGIDPYRAQRLYRKYGSRAKKILQMEKDEPQLGELVCWCEPVSAGEIVFSAQYEKAKNLMDVRRRTRLGTGNCQGRRCARRASIILSKALGLDEEAGEELYLQFLEERWKGMKPISSYSNLNTFLSFCFPFVNSA